MYLDNYCSSRNVRKLLKKISVLIYAPLSLIFITGIRIFLYIILMLRFLALKSSLRYCSTRILLAIHFFSELLKKQPRVLVCFPASTLQAKSRQDPSNIFLIAIKQHNIPKYFATGCLFIDCL